MDKWVTKYWLPFLLIALVAAILFDSSSIEKVDMDTNRKEPDATTPRPYQPSSKEVSQGDSHLAVGQRFQSLDELVNNQLTAGYVRTGYFGKQWPATVTEVATDRHKISFVRQDGTKHTYRKFDGYRMKMVRLKSGEKETIVVFRSQYRI